MFNITFQVFCAGILRLITVYYQSMFDKIIKKCKLNQELGIDNTKHEVIS